MPPISLRAMPTTTKLRDPQWAWIHTPAIMGMAGQALRTLAAGSPQLDAARLSAPKGLFWQDIPAQDGQACVRIFRDGTGFAIRGHTAQPFPFVVSRQAHGRYPAVAQEILHACPHWAGQIATTARALHDGKDGVFWCPITPYMMDENNATLLFVRDAVTATLTPHLRPGTKTAGGNSSFDIFIDYATITANGTLTMPRIEIGGALVRSLPHALPVEDWLDQMARALLARATASHTLSHLIAQRTAPSPNGPQTTSSDSHLLPESASFHGITPLPSAHAVMALRAQINALNIPPLTQDA